MQSLRLNAAGSVYLTRPSPPHFMGTRDEFTWRTVELFDSIAAGTITVTVSNHYPLKDAAQAHRDLQGLAGRACRMTARDPLITAPAGRRRWTARVLAVLSVLGPG